MEENELREPDQTTEEKNLESETEILSQKTETETASQKPESEIKELRESLRLRKSTYMKQQVEKQRAAEDLLTDQIMAEQKILDEILDSIDDNIERTEESRKYNKEVQDEINARIYAMHGITEDKMQGMRESKNAYYRGCAFSLFLLSVVLILLCGFLHGFSAEITLFMLAYTGLEGALLSKGEKRSRWLAILCRVLYLFIFPAMMVMFVCYELGYPEYEQFLPYMVIGGLVILILAVASVFLYDPYRKDKRRMRSAKNHISDIEKLAKKELKKNRKLQEREEKKEQKAQEREEKKEQKVQIQAEKKEHKKKLRAERKEQFKQKWENRKRQKPQDQDGE